MFNKLRRDWRLWLVVIMFGATLSFAAHLAAVVDAVEQEAFIGQYNRAQSCPNSVPT